MASPGVAWAKPAGKDLNMGKPRFGTDYGFMFEYWFAKNYGISTGLYGAFDGDNIKGRDKFQNDTAGNQIRSVNEKYGFHYVVLPIYLKLKTNDIKGGNFSVWGQLGVTINFVVSARATFDNPIPLANPTATDSVITIEKENILRKNNDVTQSIPDFRSNFIDVRLGGGVGFEYKFDDRTSLIVGLMYHNGFINNLLDRDPKKEAIVMRFISLRVGVLF